MPCSVTVAACQVPDFRGDLKAALSQVVTFAAKAESVGAELVVFPEGFLQGYQLPEQDSRRLAIDLASRRCDELLESLADAGPMLVLGLLEKAGAALFNTAAVIHRGRLLGRYRKTHLLPSEAWFQAGDSYPVFDVAGLRFGINICNDLRFPAAAEAVAAQGADLLVAPCNNMLPREVADRWKHQHNELRAERARETGMWILCSDVMGERDELVCYGPTAIISPSGEVLDQVPLHEVGMVIQQIPCRLS